MLKSLDKLLSAPLLGQVGSLLQFSIFLLESVIELRQLYFHIVLDIFLLISHDLENLIFEFLFTLNLQFFEFVHHRVHKRGQDLHMFGGHLLALLDIILNVAELFLEVVKALHGASDFLLLALVHVHGAWRDTQHPCIAHRVLSVSSHLFVLGRLVGELLLDTDFAKRLFLEHHNRLWEMDLTEVHLDCVREEGLLRLLVLT